MLRQATRSFFSVRLFCLLHDVRLTITDSGHSDQQTSVDDTYLGEDVQDAGKLLSCLTYYRVSFSRSTCSDYHQRHSAHRGQRKRLCFSPKEACIHSSLFLKSGTQRYPRKTPSYWHFSPGKWLASMISLLE